MIPPIIHQIWLGGNLPERYVPLINEIRRLNPSYQYILHNEESEKLIPDFIKNTYYGDKYSHKSNIMRYTLLYEYGGIYLDMDAYAIKPFDPLLNSDKIILANEPNVFGKDKIGTAVIFSPPKNPFWMKLLEYINSHFKKGRISTDNGGPHALYNFIKSTNSLNKDTSIEIVPSYVFYPVTVVKSKLEYYIPNELNLKQQLQYFIPEVLSKFQSFDQDTLLSESYTIHLWENNWSPNWINFFKYYIFDEYLVYTIIVILVIIIIIYYIFSKSKKK